MPTPTFTRWFLRARRWLGARLVDYLSAPLPVPPAAAATDPLQLMACLRPGDVLLVEGNSRVSVAIKYLTQSTWSHAALYTGRPVGGQDAQGLPRCFVEADLNDGVRAVSISAFAGLHCRICRPVGLSAAEVEALIGFVTQRLGYRSRTCSTWRAICCRLRRYRCIGGGACWRWAAATPPGRSARP